MTTKLRRRERPQVYIKIDFKTGECSFEDAEPDNGCFEQVMWSSTGHYFTSFPKGEEEKGKKFLVNKLIGEAQEEFDEKKKYLESLKAILKN